MMDANTLSDCDTSSSSRMESRIPATPTTIVDTRFASSSTRRNWSTRIVRRPAIRKLNPFYVCGCCCWTLMVALFDGGMMSIAPPPNHLPIPIRRDFVVAVEAFVGTAAPFHQLCRIGRVQQQKQQQQQIQGICTPSTTSLFLAKSGTKKKKPAGKIVAVNRIAYRNYEILDTIEAGISLLGTEIKSIRDGKLNLRDGYVRPSKNGRSCTLYNVHVGKCQQVGAEYFQHEETRPRDLLVHAAQARKFLQQTEQQGMTVIPLRAYWSTHGNNEASSKKNLLKIEIALCRGKNVRDKRVTIQERDVKRETSRIIKNFRLN